ncbi:DNA polymerase III subunit gamma/tau [Aestuariibacter sp. AA17]|uniref:DNA-directed DNA polymerase n=1 Tax=Fluctibacter corallii TaxID=2984329 RepID=A0ABT3A8P2_9ALTE|nr:DNA polymerase III subunit gamma/tau [Aestuariibacter sp. AA17]MCV2885059.1 DNA polymerase III subunit gamma/tau [Aestuariibacter sp. AA17]
MSYQVLARKWRPRTFSELVGQEHVVAAITSALENNRLHHAYLFTGTRGVGKTTIARIFSKSLNCEQGKSAHPCGECSTCKEIEQGNYVDLLEIDAASRTKVEDTRELLDNVQYKPTRGDYKVYLIDEVHMLSKHSFNALLKTLEEPPPHVKFLLATTDPQKLPITILSRCLQFNLKALSREQISTQLDHILHAESITFEANAIASLARAAQGSMRDALSLTDQAIAQGNGNVSANVVADMLGLMDKDQVLKLLHAVLSKNVSGVMSLVEQLAVQATSFEHVLDELQSLLHQVALTQFVPEVCKLETTSARGIFELAKMVSPEHVQLLYQIALNGKKDIQFAPDARTGLEMTLIRMLAFSPDNQGSSEQAQLTPMTQASAQPLASSSTSTNGPETSHANASVNSTLPAAILAQRETQSEEMHPSQPAQENAYQAQPPVEMDLSAVPTNVNLAQQAIESEQPALSEEEFSAESSALIAQQEDIMLQAQQLGASLTPETHNESVQEESTPAESGPATAPVPASTQSLTETLLSLQQSTQNHSGAKPSATSSGGEEEGKKPAIDIDEPKVQDDPVARIQAASHARKLSEFTPDVSASDTEDSFFAESMVKQNTAANETQEPKVTSLQPMQRDSAHLGAMDKEATNQAPSTTFDLSTETADLSLADNDFAQPEHSVTVDANTSEQTFTDNVAPTDSVSHAFVPNQVDDDVAQASQRVQDAPPWDVGDEDVLPHASTDVVFDVHAEQMEQDAEEFDPMAHLHDEVDVPVTVDVPAFLTGGEKVLYAHQLDTWSALIESMPITALTKQLALHAAYTLKEDTVVLTLPSEKAHLVSDSSVQQLQHALGQTLSKPITLDIRLDMPSNTPFALQKKINEVRQVHAQSVVQTDAHITSLKSAFSANIVENSIKPR